jgi:hypothetical protein
LYTKYKHDVCDVINFIPLNLIFAYVINIRLFAHFFMKRIANFHFSFNTRIKPRFITSRIVITLLDPVLVSDDCDCRFVEVIDIDKTISDHKATKLYLKIPDVIHKSYQRLTKFVKLYNCIISLKTWFFSCIKSTFRSPVTTTCWVKLNDCSIEC